MPHYRAEKFTQEIKEVLGKYYNYDPTPIVSALINTSKKCHYVDGLEGIQKYKSF